MQKSDFNEYIEALENILQWERYSRQLSAQLLTKYFTPGTKFFERFTGKTYVVYEVRTSIKEDQLVVYAKKVGSPSMNFRQLTLRQILSDFNFVDNGTPNSTTTEMQQEA